MFFSSTSTVVPTEPKSFRAVSICFCSANFSFRESRDACADHGGRVRHRADNGNAGGNSALDIIQVGTDAAIEITSFLSFSSGAISSIT